MWEISHPNNQKNYIQSVFSSRRGFHQLSLNSFNVSGTQSLENYFENSLAFAVLHFYFIWLILDNLEEGNWFWQLGNSVLMGSQPSWVVFIYLLQVFVCFCLVGCFEGVFLVAFLFVCFLISLRQRRTSCQESLLACFIGSIFSMWLYSWMLT